MTVCIALAQRAGSPNVEANLTGLLSLWLTALFWRNW